MQTTKKKHILIVLIALTLCFIWGNSLMPASISGAISEWVKDALNAVLGDVGSSGVPEDGVLRKMAHAAEFAALGVMLTLLVGENQKAKISLLVLCGLATALIDETIQLFVDGRSGQIEDVWIDLAGFVIGMAISILTAERREKTRRLRRVNYQKH